MKITLSQIGDAKLVKLCGRIDLSQTERLNDFFDKQFGQDSFHFIVDLAGVDFISSDGLAVFLGLRNKCAKRGGKLQIVCPPGLVREVFEVTHMAALFDIVDTVDEASSN